MSWLSFCCFSKKNVVQAFKEEPVPQAHDLGYASPNSSLNSTGSLEMPPLSPSSPMMMTWDREGNLVPKVDEIGQGVLQHLVDPSDSEIFFTIKKRNPVILVTPQNKPRISIRSKIFPLPKVEEMPAEEFEKPWMGKNTAELSIKEANALIQYEEEFCKHLSSDERRSWPMSSGWKSSIFRLRHMDLAEPDRYFDQIKQIFVPNFRPFHYELQDGRIVQIFSNH